MAARKAFGNSRQSFVDRVTNAVGASNKRNLAIGSILLLALLAFELFNFDTTRFALSDLLGDVQFAGLKWATILAVAFCAIDFAGLARMFTPERGKDEPHAVWYLMGAWLLGATMNAAMTWWAVSLTLLSHDLGNEILTREELLRYVPIFVAVLVWLTRILFIGSLSVAGENFLDNTARADHGVELSSPRPAVSSGNKGGGRKSGGGGSRNTTTKRKPTTRGGRPAGAVGFSGNTNATRPAEPVSFSGPNWPAAVREPNPASGPQPTTRIRRRPPASGFSAGSNSAAKSKFDYGNRVPNRTMNAKGHD